MHVLKNDFVLLLESNYKEGILLHAHKNGLWSIVSEARRLSAAKDLKENPEKI